MNKAGQSHVQKAIDTKMAELSMTTSSGSSNNKSLEESKEEKVMFVWIGTHIKCSCVSMGDKTSHQA